MTIISLSPLTVELSGREPAASRCFDRLLTRGYSCVEGESIIAFIYPELSSEFLHWLGH